MTAQRKILSEGLLRRRRLLDAARGVLNKEKAVSEKQSTPALPSFALKAHHFGDLSASSPSEFHKTLCALIRNARERVYLSSLYVGPAVGTSHPKEEELLQALSHVSNNNSTSTNSNVSIKVVLDHNRALRPVPTTSIDGKTTTTSSAQAVAEAIQQPLHRQGDTNNNSHRVHLFQVLQKPLAALLPNPLNEVVGVFHIKAYIVDDHLILSGANLSEEYFVDRQDRYMWITKGGNGLVDFYANFLEVLCRHSETYHLDKEEGRYNETPKNSKQEFLSQIRDLFQDHSPASAQDLLESDPETVAVCVPTFNTPKDFWSEPADFVSDVEATLRMLEEGAITDDIDHDTHVQLSSAYLNLTEELLETFSHYPYVDLVTAGRMSHGFRPKPKAGNKGKDWIPTVFDHLAHASQKTHATLYHWERPDWTFHAKGIWIQKQQKLLAAIVGSSNFGGRSFVRDIESNLILVFPTKEELPSTSPDKCISHALQSEWKNLLASSRPVNAQELLSSAPPLPIHIRSLLPYIKTYF